MSDLTQADVETRLELRPAVEEFLYHEAALLDEWQLDEWLALFTDDALSVVPATDFTQGDGRTSLVLVNDNIDRIRGRVNRLKSRRAHREFPWSRTRRLVTNVRVLEVDGDKVTATANFCVYRIRGAVVVYIGRYIFHLLRRDGSFMITYRRVELDLESLEHHGALSIIV